LNSFSPLVYLIDVISETSRHRIHRRFREIAKMHAELVERLTPAERLRLPKLPPKKIPTSSRALAEERFYTLRSYFEVRGAS
jgi:hypothetical protein